MKNYTFAVLVDGENASPKQLAAVLREVEKKGDIAIKRVYADWTNPAQGGWQQPLLEHGARPVHQFNNGKDAADHALIMDAIELTHSHSRIDAFCVVSSDGGYHGLAQRIREKGLFMMGIGERNTPERLRRACHHFVYRDLLEHSDEAREPSDKVEISVERLLVKAVQAGQNDDESIYLGVLGSQLKKLDPAFDPRSYGFHSLKELVKAQTHLLAVQENSPEQVYVSLREGVGQQGRGEVLEGQVSRWIHTYGFIEAKGATYYFNAVNIDTGQREHRIRTGDKVRFEVDKAPDPGAEHTSDKNGRARQVHFLEILDASLRNAS
ncbi:NYN domain-containing protein [Gallaecimonas sp. GXIMD4217]|uniref:NYN domain-containing protein n=1 Tax=Gallaecimonas sp. GXIMD4217 TaxID=3131927 RepID=UPI00311AEEA2